MRSSPSMEKGLAIGKSNEISWGSQKLDSDRVVWMRVGDDEGEKWGVKEGERWWGRGRLINIGRLSM